MEANRDEQETILLTKLNNLQDAIQKGDLNNIKEIIAFFHENLLFNKELLSKLYKSGRNCVTQTDLIISACSHNQTDVLYYLLNETDMLDYLTDASFDVNEVDKQRTEALRHAICLDNFSMVEILYDYWCGNTYCFEHDIDKIEKVECLLTDAHNACTNVKTDQKLNVDLHCLLKFNDFQQKLYTKLRKLKPKTNLPNNTHEGVEAKALGTMLLNVLDIYNEYSNVDKVRLPKSKPEEELLFKALYKDKSTVFMTGLTCIMYEVYFCKLDITVSKLILENLNVLRRHLKNRLNKSKDFLNQNPKYDSLYTAIAKRYKEIESSLYYFMYRTIDDWRLYLPANRQITTLNNCVGVHKGQTIRNLTLKYDERKVDNWPVLYFERRNFKTHLEKLRKIVKEHVISEDPLAEETVTQNQSSVNNQNKKAKVILDDNYLKEISYMRDYYSLKKTVYYLEAVANTEEIDILMIERALQVIGEMLKSTDKSKHVSSTTKALLQMALSVETNNHLHNIRQYLSHVDEGQLSRRINMEYILVKPTFERIKENFDKIKQSINPIIDIYKSLLDQSLLEKGLFLLNERIKKLPKTARDNKDNILNQYKRKGEQLFSKSSDFMQKVWIDTRFTTELLAEIVSIMCNKDELKSKKQLATTHITNRVVSILPKYIQYIKRMLQLNISIKHWESIQRVVTFFFVEMDCKVLFSLNDFVTKDSLPNDVFVPNIPTVNKIQEKLAEIEIHLNICSNVNYSFDGIEELDKNIFTKTNNKNDSERTKRSELLLCLTKRVGLLKDTLEFEKQTPLSLHQVRYKHDQKFRLVLEILLADIGNILHECKIDDLMKKSAKLLTGVNLGNVLDHGNPFLEVIGDVLNSRDLSAELLSKARMFAEDGESIAALYELYKENIDPEDIRPKQNSLNNEQKKFLDQYKASTRWESYLKLILFPESK